MTPAIPPPLPRAEPAWATYVKSAGLIVPALLLAIFARSFLLPKLEQIWQVTGIGDSSAQFLLDGAQAFTAAATYITPLLILACTALEVFSPAWPRWRRLFLTLVSQAIYWAALIGMTSLATAALVAAPMLTKSR